MRRQIKASWAYASGLAGLVLGVWNHASPLIVLRSRGPNSTPPPHWLNVLAILIQVHVDVIILLLLLPILVLWWGRSRAIAASAERCWCRGCLLAIFAGILLYVVTCELRLFGFYLPYPVNTVLTRIVGYETLSQYPNGAIAFRELRRRQSDGSWEHTVSGDYFDQEGRRRSMVRNGTGVALFFYDNGRPQAETHCVNGLPHGLQMLWWSNGLPKSFRQFDDKSDYDGRMLHYREDGSLAAEKLYDHGRKMWSSNFVTPTVIQEEGSR